MTAYGWRSVLVVLLAGAWLYALLSGQLLGGAGHVLLLGAGALVWLQLRTRPAPNPFELWQDKQRTRHPAALRRA